MSIQGYLFPWLREDVDPITEALGRLVTTLDVIGLEAFVPEPPRGAGRPPDDRRTLARAFVAKAVLGVPTTTALIERLVVDKFSTFNYYDSVGARKSAEFVRGGGIVAGVSSRLDFQFASPTYVFATPVLGGQASLGMGALVGPNTTSAFATPTGPRGGSLSASRSDSVFGVGDLYPVGSLRWSQGVNNVMTYLTGDIPVGLYNAQNLANLGIGHGAVDAGGGYTYFDAQTGHEFSAVIGATYTSSIRRRSTRTASTVIWTGAPRNFCRRVFRSARSATSTTSLRATADRAPSSDRSSRASSGSVRRSGTCSRSPACRAM